MPKYKPMLIHFDEDSYRLELKRCEEKISILNKAIQWAENYTKISDIERFAESFTVNFKKVYYESNKDKIHLDIKIDKLLELVGINVDALLIMERKFNKIDAKLDYTNGINPVVDRRKYERYTKSSKENERLRDGRRFLEVLELIEKHVKVYPANITTGTSNLIGFDIRKGEYHINI